MSKITIYCARCGKWLKSCRCINYILVIFFYTFQFMFRYQLITRVIIAFVIYLFSATTLAQNTAYIYVVKKSTISFHSNTKLELIKASSAQLKGIIDADKRTFAFSVEMKTFDGFNSPLQKEHFNENYLESDKFTNASFSGHIIEEDDFTKDGTYNIRTKGKFIVHGVEQERILQGDLFVKSGVIKLSCVFTVLLSEHNIKVPRIVNEKLSSEIKVMVTAEFIKK